MFHQMLNWIYSIYASYFGLKYNYFFKYVPTYQKQRYMGSSAWRISQCVIFLNLWMFRSRKFCNCIQSSLHLVVFRQHEMGIYVSRYKSLFHGVACQLGINRSCETRRLKLHSILWVWVQGSPSQENTNCFLQWWLLHILEN